MLTSVAYCINIGLALTCYVAFIWSAKSFFITPPEGTPRGMKRIQLAGLLTIVSTLVSFYRLPTSHLVLSCIGTLLFTLSLLMFFWAIKTNLANPLPIAFTEHSPGNLVRAGPYQIVRHPFYCSYSLCWLGGVFATEQPLLVIAVGTMWFLYNQAIKLEESQFRESSLAEEYSRYQLSTGKIFPRLLG